MAETTLQTPYSTAMPFILTASAGGWLDDYDNQRLSSYNLYDDLYNNDPTQYAMMLRGTNEKPIYIPTARKVINSLARFVGKGWGYAVSGLQTGDSQEPVDPEAVPVTQEQVDAATIAFGNLFARERLLAAFRSGVAEWLRRGDWCWMVSADALKREGRRISVRPIDPRRYFPVYGDPLDASRLTGQQVIEETMVGDTAAILVQTWLKYTDPMHPNFEQEEPEEGFPIQYDVQAYDIADYQDETKRKPLAHPSNLPPALVEGITTLPIYHIRNNETTDDPFGRSDLSGVESIIAGINQSASDEDLSLAMMGLGMYWTDSGAPIDESTGQPGNWKLGPRRVVEVDDGKKFGKVDGITSVEPFQDHMGYLLEEAQGVNGLSDVSVGTAQNISAESGVALAIRFSPTQDTVDAKNDAINTVMNQMFYDLKTWFAVYEGLDFGDVEILSVTEGKSLLPFDRAARWTELKEGIEAGVFTLEFAVQVLTEEFGYEFPADYLEKMQAAADAKAAAADPFAARAAGEAGSADQAALDASAEATA